MSSINSCGRNTSSESTATSAELPLRLLVVSSDYYPPTRVDVTVLFGAELAKRGHRIDWILQSEAACRRAYVTEWGGGRVWVGATDLGDSIVRRIRRHILGIANDCRLFSRLRQTPYDAIQIKDKFLAGVLAIIARRLFRIRFIYWLSYPFPEYYLLRAKDGTARYPLLYSLRGSAFKWLLYRWLLPAADHVFVQSEQMRLDVAAEGIPLDKMTAVPMGIDVEMFAAPNLAEARQVLPRGVPCVLYLGTLDKLRRLDFVIRAFSRVRTAVPEARLYIVGRGEHPEDQSFPGGRGCTSRSPVVGGVHRSLAAAAGLEVRERGRCMPIAIRSEPRTSIDISDEADRVHGDGQGGRCQ